MSFWIEGQDQPGPAASEEGVTVEEWPEMDVFVVSYGGWSSSEREERYADRLKDARARRPGVQRLGRDRGRVQQPHDLLRTPQRGLAAQAGRRARRGGRHRGQRGGAQHLRVSHRG